jgi:hypothetical protein
MAKAHGLLGNGTKLDLSFHVSSMNVVSVILRRGVRRGGNKVSARDQPPARIPPRPHAGFPIQYKRYELSRLWYL